MTSVDDLKSLMRRFVDEFQSQGDEAVADELLADTMSPDNPARHMRRPPASGSRLLTSAYDPASTGRRRAEASRDHPLPSPG